MTMHLAKGDYRLAFFSTFTTLAMPTDAALQQIKIECFFPGGRRDRREGAPTGT